MKNTVIKGTHNSRSILGAQDIPESWPEARAMLQSIGWPIDLSNLNPLGCLQIGTGYTTEEVLPAALQAILNLPDPATPADAFQALYRNIYGSDEVIYRWLRTRPKYVEVDTSVTAPIIANTGSHLAYVSLTSADSIEVDPTTGSISLVNPITRSYKGEDWAKEESNFVRGKFVKATNGSTIYKGGSNSSLTYDVSEFNIKINGTVWTVSSAPSTTEQIQEVVTSTDPNAYPVAGDGWTYTELEPLPAVPPCLRAQTGSYKGTGTYGPANPNSLTFNFTPKILIVATNFHSLSPQSNGGWPSYNNIHGSFMWTAPATSVRIGFPSASSTTDIQVSVSGNTISWYNTGGNSESDKIWCQFNNNMLYTYLAIG